MLMRLLEKLIKLCDEQKHDPRLMPLVTCLLALMFAIRFGHHLQDTAWAFWEPLAFFLMMLLLAIGTVRSEMQYVRGQKNTVVDKD